MQKVVLITVIFQILPYKLSISLVESKLTIIKTMRCIMSPSQSISINACFSKTNHQTNQTHTSDISTDDIKQNNFHISHKSMNFFYQTTYIHCISPFTICL